MLTALDFWRLVEHIIPVYVIVIIAYALTKFNIIEPVHVPGISRWVSILGVPTYVFHLLAFNDPYKTSLRLVAADILSKALTLISSSLWWKFSKSGSIDGVIGFFMLATLPNTVLIGDALLEPLYGEEAHTQVVTIIFTQSLLWYNLCICLYEARVVLLEEKQAQFEAAQRPFEKENEDDHTIHVHKTSMLNGEAEVLSIELPGCDSHGAGDAKEKDEIRTCSFDSNEDLRKKSLCRLAGAAGVEHSSNEATLERTISAPEGFFFSRSGSLSFKRTLRSKVCDFDPAADELSGPLEKEYTVERFPAASADDSAVLDIFSGDDEQGPQKKEKTMHDEEEDLEIISERSENLNNKSGAVLDSDSEKYKRDVVLKSGGCAQWGILGLKMVNRVKKVPLTYASIAGFVYSMIAQKYKWDMPYPIRNSLELISQGAIGMAIFLMGMAWARSGQLISCGLKALIYGIIVRFLIGPILMIISAKSVQMHGQSFGFAVLQAVIPQGVISFVLAKEYGVDVPLFNTAVIFQLIIFLPIVLCYYYILELV